MNTKEETHEETLIISTAFWIREISLIKLKLLQDDKSLTVQQIRGYIIDIKAQDRLQREKEQKIISKYFQVRTDVQFQQKLTLKILEAILIIYQRVLLEYQERNLIIEQQLLKRDIDKLKMDFMEALQESKHNMSQILTFLARFSRNRFDTSFRHYEETLIRSIQKNDICLSYQLTPKHSVHDQKATLSPQYKIYSKGRITAQQVAQRGSLLVDKHSNVETRAETLENENKTNSSLLQKSRLLNYYENIFSQAQNKGNKDSTVDEDRTKRYTNYTKKSGTSSYRMHKSPQTDRMQYNQVQIILNEASDPQKGVEIFEKYIKQSECKQNASEYQQTDSNKDEIGFSVNWYQAQREEIRNLPETDQKTHLYKIYKDLTRINLPISIGIDNFRRNYLLFMSKQIPKQASHDFRRKNISRSPIKDFYQPFWREQYNLVKDNILISPKGPNPNPTLDFKDLNKMVTLVPENQRRAIIDNSLSKSPIHKPRIKTDYLNQWRPTTSDNSRPKNTNISQNIRFNSPNHMKKLIKDRKEAHHLSVKPLNFSDFENS